jgi:hypothetical protein
VSREFLIQNLLVLGWIAGVLAGTIQLGRQIDAFGLKNSNEARLRFYGCLFLGVLAAILQNTL